VTVAGTDRLAADVTAQSFGARLEGGTRVGCPRSASRPMRRYRRSHFHLPGYSERATAGAAAFALTYGAQTTTATRTEFGAWFDHRSQLAAGAALILRGRLAWVHDFNTDRSINAVFQTLPGASFTVSGATPSADAALISAASEIRYANGVSLGPDSMGSLRAGRRVTQAPPCCDTPGDGSLVFARLGRVEFDCNLHAGKRIAYIGVTHRTRSIDELRAEVSNMRADLWDAVSAGKLLLPIDRVFDLKDAEAAQAITAGSEPPDASGYFFRAAAIRPARTRSPFRKSLNVSGSWKAGSSPRDIKLRSTKIGSWWISITAL
jgi:hypothetical protein